MDFPTGDGLLLALAAALAACLAAWTASRRMEKQLSHDRDMRDREALRTMLDDAVMAAGESFGVAADAQEKRVYDELRGAGEKGIDPEEYRELIRRSMRVYATVGMQAHRLQLRFGFNHPITRTYAELLDTLIELFGSQIDFGTADSDTEREAGHEMERKFGEFIELCRPYIGVDHDH